MGGDTWLFSTSGRDVCTAFVGGVPTLPVYHGELQARALGAKVEAFAEEGNSLVDEIGGLVVAEPLPSIPVFLSGDDDGGRYLEMYFDRWPGVWRHGDRIMSRRTAVIYGPSDATINRRHAAAVCDLRYELAPRHLRCTSRPIELNVQGPAACSIALRGVRR